MNCVQLRSRPGLRNPRIHAGPTPDEPNGWFGTRPNGQPACSTALGGSNTAPDMQIIEKDSNPYPVELQTYASDTQYCWNGTYDGMGSARQSSPYTDDETQYCIPYTALDTSAAGCRQEPDWCGLPNTLPSNDSECARWNVQEVGYLAQTYYSVDYLEIYHSDLDDESQGDPMASTDNADDPPGPTALQGVDHTLSEMLGGSDVPDPIDPLNPYYFHDPPCPVNTQGG